LGTRCSSSHGSDRFSVRRSIRAVALLRTAADQRPCPERTTQRRLRHGPEPASGTGYHRLELGLQPVSARQGEQRTTIGS